jgi:hypothetical protein
MLLKGPFDVRINFLRELPQHLDHSTTLLPRLACLQSPILGNGYACGAF